LVFTVHGLCEYRARLARAQPPTSMTIAPIATGAARRAYLRLAPFPFRTSVMAKAFKAKTFRIGDHVSWNSEAGRVRGKILRVHKQDVNYKGYVHHASPDDPQYEIKSDKTEHVALHKGRALRRLSD
jgi:hypothetical protein